MPEELDEDLLDEEFFQKFYQPDEMDDDSGEAKVDLDRHFIVEK